MSNYRRLISYIYAYEGGVKGKNIGYAKVEVRGDQCRIQVNVKKVYVGSNDIGVYLLSPGTEIMLGKIFIRGGAGEFRVSVQSGNVEGSGYSMDQCYGLTVHDVESTWQCYTTIWEDAVAQTAEHNSADVTEKAAELELADVTAENVRAKEIPTEVQIQSMGEEEEPPCFPVSEKIEQDLTAEELRMSKVAPRGAADVEAEEKAADNWLPEPAGETLLDSMEKASDRVVTATAGMRNYIGELADSVVEESMEGLEETMRADAAPDGDHSGADAGKTADAAAPFGADPMSDDRPITVIGSLTGGASIDPIPGIFGDRTPTGPFAGIRGDQPQNEDRTNLADAKPKPEVPQSTGRMMQEAVQQALQALVGGIMTGPEKPAAKTEKKPTKNSSEENNLGNIVGQIEPAPIPEPGDPAQLEALDRMVKEAADKNPLWKQLGRSYPRVLAFDYVNGCEILSIKPQDIGLLPREVWMYGNNSFLLHGYYNYRHLIIAKLNNPNGRPRYLLGVPGHYFSNEKYMASMFGFPHFVLAKKQPEADGRFGYWYTDIRM